MTNLDQSTGQERSVFEMRGLFSVFTGRTVARGTPNLSQSSINRLSPSRIVVIIILNKHGRVPSMSFTPEQFISKWAKSQLKETAADREHFIDVCRLVGHPTPAEVDPIGDTFTFQAGVKKSTGEQGYADVWYRDHFAMEYKGKHKDLRAAYQQLQQYRENLHNPPLLVVCDFDQWEIHTNFDSAEKVVYKFTNADLTNPLVLGRLRDLFYAPKKLHPKRDTAQVTRDAAYAFKLMADNMRGWVDAPARIAQFMTKLVFCLFAEDVGLLPAGPSGDTGIFSEIIERSTRQPSLFEDYLHQLFAAMAKGGNFLFQNIPYFNGSLFEDVHAEPLILEALRELEKAARLNWVSIEPSIFGTLFERSLDPAKRAQLGAHYTSRADILLIVEPVLMQPLRREWEAMQPAIEAARAAYDTAPSTKDRLDAQRRLLDLREQMRHRLNTIKVLDPACGSGNFLYVALGLLLDLEKAVINHPPFSVLERVEPSVHPRQLYGLELNPIAHALSSIVVWIGYIQWRQLNGYPHFTEPILEPLGGNIQLMDAILAHAEDGTPIEPEWPAVDVIVGNPPFLGAKKMKRELGRQYVDELRTLYQDRLSNFSDLVTYWFEKARDMVRIGRAQRVGLLATNSIAMGTNLPVLRAIKDTGDIFMAYRDREWILNGAAVRVSMVGFDDGSEQSKTLDGVSVPVINATLRTDLDVTIAVPLSENTRMAFIGNQKSGPFDIPKSDALKMVAMSNANGANNADVLHPYFNAIDLVQRERSVWVIDFGPTMTLEEAQNYEAPYQYVVQNVYPVRLTVDRKAHRERWWIHGDARPGLHASIANLTRYIATPLVSKHRIFNWLSADVVPANLLIAIARDDDYFFGVLHSRLHEVWSLRMGTWLGKGNDPRYTPTTTFETYPFPWPPAAEPTDDPRYQAIAAAAHALHTEREAWLNPPNASEKQLKERTLTHLYNALAVWRGTEKIKVPVAAADFAPRLADLHDALDAAVCAAYGWSVDILHDEEAMLRHLLALNLERAARGGAAAGVVADAEDDDDDMGDAAE